MAASGVGKLVFVDGIMHKMAHLNILQNNLKESADKLGLGSNFIFQQDNDPKHTAFVNLWSHFERSVQKHQITSKEQLKSVLQDEWLNIALETTRHLVESMPRRLEAVISAKDLTDDVFSQVFIKSIVLEKVAAIHRSMVADWAGLVSYQAKPVEAYSQKVMSGV
ncbi:transposable element Tcb2 transposase [Trichonephila clavipes]|nr:transposable element Tcb2 transposase [Trichonephila clavipes]